MSSMLLKIQQFLRTFKHCIKAAVFYISFLLFILLMIDAFIFLQIYKLTKER